MGVVMHHVQGACRHVPGQRLGPVVNLWTQRFEAAVQVLGLGRFGAVQRGIGALEFFGLTAVDLPAVAAAFIDQDGLEASLD